MSLIYLGLLMSATNKIVIPFNSMFSIDAFFSVLLRKVNPLWFTREGNSSPDFSAGREISMVTSGTLSDFQDDMAGPEYSGDMPQPSWNSVVNLRVNLRPCLCAPFPSTFRCGWRHVTPDLLLLKTFHCGRSSVRHLAVNFSKPVKSLILSGKVKEPPNVS